jgi:bla regulator protein blaR1
MDLAPSISWPLLEPIADHLWQSTAVLGVTAVLALLLRNNRAQVRHCLWLVASAKFAVPFALLTAVGSGIALPVGRTVVSDLVAPATAVAEPFGQVFIPMVDRVGDAGTAFTSLWPMALAVVWLFGALALTMRWLMQWRSIARVAAAGSPATTGREVQILRALERRAGHRRPLALVLTDSPLEPGVFGVLRPVLLWPRAMSARLDDRQVEAILAHELAHVRRHDNLTALVHMTVQAVFWFHPLVWWLGARLIEERERACDEDVVRLGSDPETYATGILQTCRFQLESPVACVSGVTGAKLTRRIEEIMTKRATHALTLRRKLLLAVVVLAGLVGPVLAGSMHSSSGVEPGGSSGPTAQTSVATEQDRIGPSRRSYSLFEAFREHFPLYRIHRLGAQLQSALFATRQTPSQNPAAAPAQFEVASVKENVSGDNRITFGLQGERFTAVNVPMRELLRFA